MSGELPVKPKPKSLRIVHYGGLKAANLHGEAAITDFETPQAYTRPFFPLLIVGAGEDVEAAMAYSKAHYIPPMVNKIATEIKEKDKLTRETGGFLAGRFDIFEPSIRRILGRSDDIDDLIARCKAAGVDGCEKAAEEFLLEKLQNEAGNSYTPAAKHQRNDKLTEQQIQDAFATLPEWMRVICEEKGLTIIIGSEKLDTNQGVALRGQAYVVILNENLSPSVLASTLFEEVLHRIEADPDLGKDIANDDRYRQGVKQFMENLIQQMSAPGYQVLDPNVVPEAIRHLAFGHRFFPKISLFHDDWSLPSELLVDMAHAEVAARMAGKHTAAAKRRDIGQAFPPVIFTAYDAMITNSIDYAANILEKRETSAIAGAKKAKWMQDPFGEYAEHERRYFETHEDFEAIAAGRMRSKAWADYGVKEKQSSPFTPEKRLPSCRLNSSQREKLSHWAKIQTNLSDIKTYIHASALGPPENESLALEAIHLHGKRLEEDAIFLLVEAATHGKPATVKALLEHCPGLHKTSQPCAKALVKMRMAYVMGMLSQDVAKEVEAPLDKAHKELVSFEIMDDKSVGTSATETTEPKESGNPERRIAHHRDSPFRK